MPEVLHPPQPARHGAHAGPEVAPGREAKLPLPLSGEAEAERKQGCVRQGAAPQRAELTRAANPPRDTACIAQSKVQ